VPSDAHNSVAAALRNQEPLGSTQDGEPDIQAMRQNMENLTAANPLPEGAVCTPVDAAGVAAEWIDVASGDPKKVLLYLHGGGYIIGSIATHHTLAAHIAQAAGTRCLIIDYRLAPEHPFPAAVEDAVAAYDFLLAEGVAPENIAIGGDSAGGGLTFATLVALKDAGKTLPGAAFALSPWVDLEGTGESMQSKADVDPMISIKEVEMMGALYLAGSDPHSPLAAPLYADLSGLPPILVQVGTAETLLDDATRIAARARDAGVAVELETYEDLIHVFQAFAPLVPESVEAIAKIGAFVKRHL
jgi:monoterpene epsilon-lactone hydrolase